MLRLPKRYVTIALFSSLLAASAQAAPTLTVGVSSGQASTVVNLPVTFDPGTSNVAVIQYDLTLPSALTLVSYSTGSILTSAGKGIASAKINSTTWRFFIGSVNVNTISNGTLMTLQLMIAGGTAPSTLNVTVPSGSVEYDDPAGTILAPGPTTNGTVTVNSPNPGNSPPVVSPISHNATDVDPATSGLQIYDGTTVTYTGTTSDSDGDPVTWQWLYTVNGGPEILMASGTNPPTAVQPMVFNYPVGSAPKTYVWILRANDGVTAPVQSTLTVSVIARPAATAPTLAAGTASGSGGTAVDLPINFDPGTASVSSIQFDLALPPALSTVSFTAGAILNSAGKSVTTSLINGNTWRFVVFGMNQNTLAGGPLLTARLRIASGTPAGSLSVPVSGTVFANPSGVTLPAGTSTGGTITVTASAAAMPVPDLSDISSTVGLNDSLSVKNAASYSNVDYVWTFGPVSESAQGSGLRAQTAAGALGASFTSGAKTASLASYGLQIGTYLLTVQVVDKSNPANTASASKTISVVQANLSLVKVYPNPWRKDRHDGKKITFDNLSANATIKIFTASGREVKSLSTSGAPVTWDLTNESGDHVASGLYIYLITNDQGEKVRGKLAVIR